MLINHKFHDEFGYTKGPFPEYKHRDSDKPRASLMIKKTVSEAHKRKDTLKNKSAMRKKSSIDKPAASKSHHRLMPQKKVLAMSKFDFHNKLK